MYRVNFGIELSRNSRNTPMHAIKQELPTLIYHCPGWLVFSGKKSDLFPEGDELVAIVYDGAYNVLDSHKFAVESDSTAPNSA